MHINTLQQCTHTHRRNHNKGELNITPAQTDKEPGSDAAFSATLKTDCDAAAGLILGWMLFTRSSYCRRGAHAYVRGCVGFTLQSE